MSAILLRYLIVSIAIFLAGAYGASASPAAFLGHPSPRELLLG